MRRKKLEQPPVILFDGVCNLCTASVLLVIRHERAPLFKFASIQSEAGQGLLGQYELPSDYMQSVILIEEGNIYFGSTAALTIGKTLKFPWSTLSWLGFLFPKWIRNGVYRQIAGHRYPWFGKRETCMVPTDRLKARFL